METLYIFNETDEQLAELVGEFNIRVTNSIIYTNISVEGKISRAIYDTDYGEIDFTKIELYEQLRVASAELDRALSGSYRVTLDEVDYQIQYFKTSSNGDLVMVAKTNRVKGPFLVK